jgi:hypothetical protein
MAKLEENREAQTYRFYVSEALRVLTENTGRNLGGTEINKRLSDILKGSKKTETRTGEEIIKDISTRLRNL